MIIDGLNPHQARLLDMMWTCEKPSELYALRKSLSEHDRRELDVLVELVMLETQDDDVKKMKRFPIVENLIKKIKNV